jgi:hypothetical protein
MQKWSMTSQLLKGDQKVDILLKMGTVQPTIDLPNYRKIGKERKLCFKKIRESALSAILLHAARETLDATELMAVTVASKMLQN